MRREMKSYTWIAMTVMLVWSVALFSANTYNNKTDNSPFRYTLVQGKTAPNAMPFRSTSTYQSVVGESNIFCTEETTTPVGSPTPYYTPFRARKGVDDEEGDEVGVIDTPIGEPLVLLLMAGAYFLFATLRKRQKA
jgi:hypothetical protein